MTEHPPCRSSFFVRGFHDVSRGISFFTRAHVLDDAWHRVDDFFAYHLQGRTDRPQGSHWFGCANRQSGHAPLVSQLASAEA